MKKIATLKLEVHSPTGGKNYIYPDCGISRCLVNLLKKSCLSPRELLELDEIFDIEYKGKRHEALEELKAKYIK